jgi:probable phosphoglycerate mutase
MTVSKTTFLLIRHGETQWNAHQRFQGHGDSPLTPRGRAETEALGRRLAHIPFDRLISSDLGRAKDTAGIIANHTGHVLEVDSALRERNYGELEGLTVPEIRSGNPEAYKRLLAGDPDFVIPGGESRRQHFDRNIDFFTAFVRKYPGSTAALVVHGGVLDSLFRFVADRPLDQPPCYITVNSSLSIIAHGPFFFATRWVIQTWGDVGHLEKS